MSLWLINNRNLFLLILEPGKSKIKKPADLVSGEDLLPGPKRTFSFWTPHMAERKQGISLGSLYHGTNPIHEDSTLIT